MSEQAQSSAGGRIELVDLARGIALLAMFVYHFAYDLSYFRLIGVDVVSDPGWRAFARLIAGSFLAVVGFSLVLSTRNGFDRGNYLRRLALIACAAILVTSATWFALPQIFIFFGILHHIALASVLALPFLFLPTLVIALAAVVVFALPFILGHDLFTQDWLSFLGFGPWPLTADFVPVFPWFGCVLAGMALARIALPKAQGSGWANWRATSTPAKLVVLGGRNSLFVYLVHQPLFIGALFLFMQATGPKLPDAEAVPFLTSCQRSCTATGTPKEICERVCSCSMEGLKQANLWVKVTADALSPAETEQARGIGQSCARQP
ncbi:MULTISPECIES: heparan-alpha-glucosaminide N-acetyltransferase [unclassified Bosea (in: a-proteobacteria)]|uniref:DUF1624 domain-containing protein n=1 Tax=unclassified Bosea (in: a-proteobacteria) TaxID=2653178 RepID=UPI000F752B0F|nr:MULTISPECIES: heparan-alpha-glucosaminide N-acetyltransferase [unclassified Bosea (in: a-proteobacteria)]AZO76787.1 hypothetical protein BLM15_03565 [Bosea sp. Tri-49]